MKCHYAICMYISLCFSIERVVQSDAMVNNELARVVWLMSLIENKVVLDFSLAPSSPIMEYWEHAGSNDGSMPWDASCSV